MRKRVIIPALIAVVLSALAFPAWAQTESEERNFREIKLLIFDESFAEALARLDAFLKSEPSESFLVPALYYRAKCLEKIGGREEEALRGYQKYLGRGDRNKSLSSDAEASIIDLSMKLYEKGDRSFLPEIEDRLTHPEKDVRYFAALRLSSLKEKKAAAKSAPVLKKMLAEEKDAELLDRAKIALLRVEPEALAAVPDRHTERSGERRARFLHIQILDLGTNKAELSLNLPIGLADLALAAISQDDKDLMMEKGYDISRIVKDLKSTGTILEIKDEKEGKIIKVWID
ncbi:MAG: hypothetical protein JW843_03565 [Candidatus Aminicenantes bacterium]|nr:hypothetical protein [Candidatus Aminicenantes bacterium]